MLEKLLLVKVMTIQQVAFRFSLFESKLENCCLSRQNEVDVDPRAIQQINFTANLGRAGNTTIFFIIEEAIETSEFSQGTVKVL